MKMKNHDSINEGFVDRMSLNFRIQHMVLFLSLIILALTGLALYFHGSWLGNLLIKIEGGLESRGQIHRVSAIVLIFLSLYHILHILFTEHGHSEFMKIIPGVHDFRDSIQDILYSLSLTNLPAETEKYGYREKFQYWGVAGGAFVMTISGFALWFKDASMSIFPKWLIDTFFVLHGRAGLLIFFLLFLWHIYDMHLSPPNFPMDWSWLNGKISLEKLKKTHYKEYQRITGEK